MLKIAQFTLTLLTAATLVACGGGSSNASSSQPPVVTPPALASAGYAGTWKDLQGGCALSDVRVNNATGANLRELAFITLTPQTDTTVKAAHTLKLYAPTDTACAGAVVATEVKSPFNITITGTAAFGGQTFDKIQFGTEMISTTSLVVGSFTASNSSLGSSATTINGYFFPAGYFSLDQQSGEKGYLRATATNLFCDNDTGTTTAYPTGVDIAACFLKI
jgi:hypothetical protein